MDGPYSADALHPRIGTHAMRFHADLHVHSKYSRATSRDLDLEHLAFWAGRKGIGVVATGDFTHPAWRAELKEKLIAAEPGLFRLRPEIEHAVAARLPPACRTPARFMLAVEISTIYKKGGRTRKIHHLIYAASFATVDRIADRLARIGNIASDGRPILGLDSRDLLEITLDAGDDAYLVPAHIWTPWFAALGSQSGFDSIRECYGDLSDHIFAVETGLSSDPPMNWRVSSLDRYRLVSNSDAHSPGKLGREATTFDCELDYFAIRRALETGDGLVGTVEFFPEEGKYHLDGHRKCEVRLSPRETIALGGRCPACGRPVTVGVEHRVEALADREPGGITPESARAVSNLVPLPEVLSEIVASGPTSRAVEMSYERLTGRIGPELFILGDAPLEEVARGESSLLSEALARLRAGRVIRDAGYDGEYGTIRLFEDGEIKRLTAGGMLFDAPPVKRRKRAGAAAKLQDPEPVAQPTAAAQSSAPAVDSSAHAPVGGPASFPEHVRERLSPGAAPAGDILAGLDEDQRTAAAIVDGPLLIIAGPGSGKTRTMTHRLAHVIAARGVAPAQCLAVTFTRRAAAEMHERLARLLPAGSGTVAVHTFHSLGLMLLRERPEAAGLRPGFRIAGERERASALAEALGISERRAEALLRAVSRAKRAPGQADAETAAVLAAHDDEMRRRNWVDFDDLVVLAVQALEADAGLAAQTRRRFRWISVDEFQDIDEVQYRLVTLLTPPDGNLGVIGDPNQAIYGFRGADASCFARFRRDFPSATAVTLRRNYRSSGTIVSAAAQMIGAPGNAAPLVDAVRDMHERIEIHVAPSERAEAEFVVQTIERLIGGHSFFSIDSGRSSGAAAQGLSFADFAVLYRTDSQSGALCEALGQSGIPFKRHSHAPLARDAAVRAILDALDANGAVTPDDLRAAALRVKAADPASIETALHRLAILAEASAFDHTRFLDAVTLSREADFFDHRAECVSLLTLHAAKGLEFPVVMIVGLEDGILPLHWSGLDPASAAEERRLFYVGMTRAMDRLVLSRARERAWNGRLRENPPSPFLNDIKSELLKHQRISGRRRGGEGRQLSLL